MAGELVLVRFTVPKYLSLKLTYTQVTGGSGHLGFRVIVRALEAGYRVRAPVRSTSKIAVVKGARSVQKYLDKLEFILVPDILEEGAYDEAVKGVSYIVHSASPLAVDVGYPQTSRFEMKQSNGDHLYQTIDYERDIINPAVKGTIGILTSASSVYTVKRVVITFSAAAIIPFKELTMVESDTVFTGMPLCWSLINPVDEKPR